MYIIWQKSMINLIDTAIVSAIIAGLQWPIVALHNFSSVKSATEVCDSI